MYKVQMKFKKNAIIDDDLCCCFQACYYPWQEYDYAKAAVDDVIDWEPTKNVLSKIYILKISKDGNYTEKCYIYNFEDDDKHEEEIPMKEYKSLKELFPIKEERRKVFKPNSAIQPCDLDLYGQGEYKVSDVFYNGQIYRVTFSSDNNPTLYLESSLCNGKIVEHNDLFKQLMFTLPYDEISKFSVGNKTLIDFEYTKDGIKILKFSKI